MFKSVHVWNAECQPIPGGGWTVSELNWNIGHLVIVWELLGGLEGALDHGIRCRVLGPPSRLPAEAPGGWAVGIPRHMHPSPKAPWLEDTRGRPAPVRSPAPAHMVLLLRLGGHQVLPGSLQLRTQADGTPSSGEGSHTEHMTTSCRTRVMFRLGLGSDVVRGERIKSKGKGPNDSPWKGSRDLLHGKQEAVSRILQGAFSK